jgi:hypothetical protein
MPPPALPPPPPPLRRMRGQRGACSMLQRQRVLHARCPVPDRSAPPLATAQADNGSVFGAFTSRAWGRSDGYVGNAESFVFRLQVRVCHAIPKLYQPSTKSTPRMMML